MQNDIQALKRQGFGMIAVLMLEYILGITTNLFVQFPQGKQGGQLWAFAWKQIPLALHIVIGFLLLLGSFVLLIRSIKYKKKVWVITSSIALVGIFAASMGGSIFIPSQVSMYSFIMATGFIVALCSYFWGIYQSK